MMQIRMMGHAGVMIGIHVSTLRIVKSSCARGRGID